MKRNYLRNVVALFGAMMVLGSMLGCKFRQSNHNSAKVKARAALKDLVMGIKNYQVEYNHYPFQTNAAKSPVDLRYESSGKLLMCLLGQNVDDSNPRGIIFLEPTTAKNGKGGLIVDGTAPTDRMVDPWGHPYILWIDTNYDGKIANPDVKNTSSLISKDAPPMLTSGVIGISMGPDGIEGTEDDVVSWRN